MTRCVLGTEDCTSLMTIFSKGECSRQYQSIWVNLQTYRSIRAVVDEDASIDIHMVSSVIYGSGVV